MSGQQQIYLIASIKNEGPFLLEFVAHHLVLGFDRIFIASNDCTDGSDRLLDALDRAGYITHVRNEVKRGQVPQHEGYMNIRRTEGLDATDWLMMLDADEFLNVHIGDHTVQALVAVAGPQVDIIALNAANFGANGEAGWRKKPVTEMFRYRHPTRHKMSTAVKTLTRNPQEYRSLHAHCVVGYEGPKTQLQVLCADGAVHAMELNEPLWRQLRNFPAVACSHDMAQYNHYSVKTYDTFCLRRDRGRGSMPVGKVKPRHTDAYFLARANAPLLDETIARYSPALWAKFAEMVAHPEVARRQRAVERVYRQMIEPYKASEPQSS